MCRHDTVPDAVRLHGQHSEGFQRSEGPALPAELSAFWAWTEGLGRETGSGGEVLCSFTVLQFGVPICSLSVPHAIWRYDADVGSLDFKSTASTEQSWPVHTTEQTHHGAREMQRQRLAQHTASQSSGVSLPHLQLLHVGNLRPRHMTAFPKVVQLASGSS